MKIKVRILSMILCTAVIFGFATAALPSVYAATAEINYKFTGSDSETAGYAEGTVMFTAAETGTYYLYWADDTGALSDYYEITSFSLSQGQTGSFDFLYHTAIPAGARKVIAIKGSEAKAPSNTLVSNAAAVYDIPKEKQFAYSDNEAKYKFASYSDIHIDVQYPDAATRYGFYKYSETHWADALDFAAKKDVDFIVTSGDNVTNAAGTTYEWDAYTKILADSDYVNPIYESSGNHEMRTGTSSGLIEFTKATGLDSEIDTLQKGKPYYYVVEPKTGDVFIFMALEGGYKTRQQSQFSDEQLMWFEALLEKYYGTGVNIYVVQHALIDRFGAGDDLENPYYGAGLQTYFLSGAKFQSLMVKYKDIIWLSGHTHQDYSEGNNYSNENGTACNMIHNSSVAGPTHRYDGVDELGNAVHNQDYSFYADQTQGYYVQVFGDQVVFNGANLYYEKIYPKYCYIMTGSANSAQDATNPTQKVTASPAPTGETVDPDDDFRIVYFVNTLGWDFVDCHFWNTTKTTKWPGLGMTYLTDTESGYPVYYAHVPKSANYTNVVFNNADMGAQTVDLTLTTYDCYTPTGAKDTNKNYLANASMYTGSVKAPDKPIITPDYTLGDVDENGSIGINDANLVQKYCAKTITLSSAQLLAADVDGDNRASIIDATLIQKYIAKVISVFPADKQVSAQNVKSIFTAAETGKLSETLSETSAQDIKTLLTSAKTQLDSSYKMSSYDQYQALKKLYYTYKNSYTNLPDSLIESVCEQLSNAMAELTSIQTYADTLSGDAFTVYFAVPADWTNAGYTVKSNIKTVQGKWSQHAMRDTKQTYNGLKVYYYTYPTTDFIGGAYAIDTIQFQAYSGSTWKAQYAPYKASYVTCESLDGMLYTGSAWVAFAK